MPRVTVGKIAVMNRLGSLIATLIVTTGPLLAAEKAPSFRLVTLDGKTFTNKNLRGKVVVLDFWATWCGPCRQVSKIMQTLQKKYAGKAVQIVCVDVKEQGPSAKAVQEYIASHGYTYPFSVDNGKLDGPMKVETLPVVIVLDKAGNIAYRHENLPGTQEGVTAAIQKALAK